MPLVVDHRYMSDYSVELEIRYRDIDALGHVNNSVYATYAEQARTLYCRDVLETSLASLPIVVASLSIDYVRPIELDEGTVAIDVEVPAIGTSSFPMAYEMRVDDGVAAEVESTQVFIDPESERPAPIPDEFRSAIAAYHDL